MELMELIEKYSLTEEELEFIQKHEEVESCSYEGLEQGHGGDYVYHIKLYNDDEVYSVATPR